MKYIFYTFLTLILLSCGEDRTHEYEELTQNNRWVLSFMRENYLWGDEIKDPENSKDFFGADTEFFSKLLKSTSHRDQWSYCTVDSAASDPFEHGNINHLDSYGIEYHVMNDPTKTSTRPFVHITYVVDGSPAQHSGLHRGDFISYIDDTRITSGNATKFLSKGTAHSLTVHHADTLDGNYVWKDTATIHLQPSGYIVEPAFPAFNKIPVGGSWIAYLQCNNLNPSQPGKDDNRNVFTLDSLMLNLYNTFQPTEFVLDLRHCNSGTIEQAQRIASYLLPSRLRSSSPFLQTIWNSSHSYNNRVYNLDTTLPSLELNRIYIITSSYTRGAAEWLICGLKQALGDTNVILVGEPTAGQTVMTQWMGANNGHQFYPAVAYVASSDGNTDYAPYTPNFPVSETDSRLILNTVEYGKMQESLLLIAITAMFYEEETEE